MILFRSLALSRLRPRDQTQTIRICRRVQSQICKVNDLSWFKNEQGLLLRVRSPKYRIWNVAGDGIRPGTLFLSFLIHNQRIHQLAVSRLGLPMFAIHRIVDHEVLGETSGFLQGRKV